MRDADRAWRCVDAGCSDDHVTAQPRVDHPRILGVEECENGNEDEEDDSKYGEPQRSEDAADQARFRRLSLKDPSLRFLCDSYQGSTNLRSFQLRRAVRFLLTRFGCWLSS